VAKQKATSRTGRGASATAHEKTISKQFFLREDGFRSLMGDVTMFILGLIRI